MPNHLPVASLKLGDRFEFLTTQTEGSKPAVLVVTRNPAVNTIANSCQFRYQSDAMPGDSARKWDDNQSWNGTPNVLVRILDRQPQPAAASTTSALAAPEGETMAQTPTTKAPKK